MIRTSLLLLILLAACTPEKEIDGEKTVVITPDGAHIVIEKDWRYVPCNGTTKECGKLE
tara:strand:+ start:786 stop:962 length:177 start_codon:yes stop_codon:yes gene_type:complete